MSGHVNRPTLTHGHWFKTAIGFSPGIAFKKSAAYALTGGFGNPSFSDWGFPLSFTKALLRTLAATLEMSQ